MSQYHNTTNEHDERFTEKRDIDALTKICEKGSMYS
jgi:hypothetical protein